ncbi:MAG TPA: alanine racemase [Thermoanaerobaculia bacterium]|nr:alanine racemase [Thermoanaerobaculia bacterium]
MNALDELPTPSVLVDLDVLERNIARMQEKANRAGVKLRPHAKTHKSGDISRMQLAAGARGLTLAKTSEAEVFADLGIDDVFLAYPVVGADKARRLLALADRMRLTVGADSLAGAQSLGDAFRAAGRRLRVLLKIDSGFHRVGVAPEDAVETARRIADVPGIELAGVFTHGGHGYAGRTPADVARIGSEESRIVSETAEALRAAGLPAAEVSLGSTPTAASAMTGRGVTECRPGTYVFNDRSQLALGACNEADCAMTVLATVVSTPAPDRAVLDAGSKTLSSDPRRPEPDGFGLVVGRRTRIARVSEEHGVLAVAPGETFRVGERVRVLPNHACAVTNLADQLTAVRAGRVEGRIPVHARGRVQ